MARTYTSQRALPSDAHAIASFFVLSWKSPFSRLKYDNVEPNALANTMTSRIAQQIDQNSMLYMVAHDAKTTDLVSVAQWTVPAPTPTADMQRLSENPETAKEQEDREEREAFEDELYFHSLPSTSNRALIVEFARGLRKLRQRIVQGQAHFVLENLATHPEHRGRGLAARLMSDVLDMADQRGLMTYLEMAEDNKARDLYERLGFEERGRETIRDLERFASRQDVERVGMGSELTYVGFVREPQQKED